MLVAAAANGRAAPEALRILLIEKGVKEVVTAAVIKTARTNHDAQADALKAIEDAGVRVPHHSQG